MIFLRKLISLILVAVFVLPVLGTPNVQAFTHERNVPPTNELNPLTPVDGIVSPQAIIVDIPGPIKYYTFVSNAQLKKIIEANGNFERNLGLAQSFLSATTLFSATTPTDIALNLTNSPLRRMEQAYYSGENMYIGEYYPTPRPGLSTVPFRYYTKTPLTFRPNY